MLFRSNIANDPSVELNPHASWEVNVLATMRLVDRAARHGVKQFIFASSSSVYGLNGEPRQVEGWVNGDRRQSASTRLLIFPIEQLVEFVTFVMTLEPGDIISTGTPEGIGPIRSGDTVAIKIEGVGELVNPVEAE